MLDAANGMPDPVSRTVYGRSRIPGNPGREFEERALGEVEARHQNQAMLRYIV